jgi:glycosyltransferase involved in cell wall biosynthesis
MIDSIFISVLMTSYNREKFIAEAIESVLASSYKNFELIIVDDCSNDTTIDIARYYASKDNRIKIFANKNNLGQFPNRNKAVSLATGAYIITVDSDDKILTNTIEYLIESMLEFPEAAFGMYCTSQKNNICLNSSEAIYHHFFKEPILTHGPGGTIFKKLFFDSIGGYPVNYGVPGDMYFNLKAAHKSPVVLITKPFMYYRRHEGQEINNSFDYLINNYRYLNEGLHEIPFNLKPNEIDFLQKKNKRRFFVNILKYFFSTFNFGKTKYALSKSSFGFKDIFIAIFQK